MRRSALHDERLSVSLPEAVGSLFTVFRPCAGTAYHKPVRSDQSFGWWVFAPPELGACVS